MNEDAQKDSARVLAKLDSLLAGGGNPSTRIFIRIPNYRCRRSGRRGWQRTSSRGWLEVITGVGKTGVVGLLERRRPTVMLRADMDALPVKEATGVPYASNIKAKDREGKTVPVMHACGHDMHVTWLMGAATLLSRSREAWRGTPIAVFQPAEETAEGAQAMIDDGLFKRFPKPEVVLGQHVMVGLRRSIPRPSEWYRSQRSSCRFECSDEALTARLWREASLSTDFNTVGALPAVRF